MKRAPLFCLMKILYTSDIHTDRNHLFSMLGAAIEDNVDRIIVGGDIVPHSLPDKKRIGLVEAQATYLNDIFIPAMMKFKKATKAEVYLDLSNDDAACNRSILEAYDDMLFHLLHMKTHRLTETIDIAGYMMVPPTPFGLKDWEKPDSRDLAYARGNTVRLHGFVSTGGRLQETRIDPKSADTIEGDLEILSGMIERPFLFVSHCPPFDTSLDVLYNGLHVGSLAIKRFIARWSLAGMLVASFHGHIHESPTRSGSICSIIEKSPCYNPGQNAAPGAGLRYLILQLSTQGNSPGIDLIKSV